MALVALGASRAGARVGADDRPSIRAELRSWVVAGRGRHLYLDVKPGSGRFQRLAGRVEFTSAAQRTDYTPPADVRLAGRVAKMSWGFTLRPLLGEPDNRLEAVYWLTPVQAEQLQRDRVFSATYALVGTNSNSGIARAMRDAGLTLPRRVSEGGGLLGEFPGVDLEPGPEIPAEQWGRYGIR